MSIKLYKENPVIAKAIADGPSFDEQALFDELVRLLYVNPKQLAFKRAPQRVRTLLAGRGLGKTTIGADFINDAMAEMPGSKGFLYGSDLNQLKTKEIVEIAKWWKRLGMSKYSAENPMGDYVIGTEPPKGWRVVNHYEDWKNVVSFPDGCTLELISEQMKNPKGGSYDYGLAMEAAELNRARFFQYVEPMVRGEVGKYKSRFYLNWVILSNQSYDMGGSWVNKMEEMAIDDPDEYYYSEGTIYDNQDIFGIDYIERKRVWMEKMYPLVWRVEYMNKKATSLENSFYKKWNDRILYDSDADNVDPWHDTLQLPLDMSWDFNKNFHSASVWQDHGQVLACLNALYVHSNDQILLVVDQFLEYYEFRHYHKVVNLYGDVSGHHIRVAETGKSYFQTIKERLESAGWKVVVKVKHTLNPGHYEKHQAINKCMMEDEPGQKIIRMHRTRCKPMYLSVVNATITSGMKKDKTPEKKLTGNDRIKATDFSDNLDYYVFPKLTQNSNTGGMEVGVM